MASITGIFCNNCFQSQTNWNFFIASCGHVLCAQCTGNRRVGCAKCKRPSKVLKVAKNDFCKKFFVDPRPIARDLMKTIAFQQTQMKLLVEHFVYENDRLKRVIAASRKQSAFLRSIVSLDERRKMNMLVKDEPKTEYQDEGFSDLASSIKSGRSYSHADALPLSDINWDEPLTEEDNRHFINGLEKRSNNQEICKNPYDHFDKQGFSQHVRYNSFREGFPANFTRSRSNKSDSIFPSSTNFATQEPRSGGLEPNFSVMRSLH